MADVSSYTRPYSNEAGQNDVDGPPQCMTQRDPEFILLLVLAAHPDLELNFSRMSELSHRLPDPDLWTTSADIEVSISSLLELSQQLRKQPPRIVHDVDDTTAAEISGQYQNCHDEKGIDMTSTRNYSVPAVQSESRFYECPDLSADDHLPQADESTYYSGSGGYRKYLWIETSTKPELLFGIPPCMW
ncbi:hypothetical protein VTN77DRAFT_4913 [Rasamsonia byssochlamydoides]|uniref:uncharacterized protein n=1 Tax=Rasamsonia byssochlamydoides TaxID=89139 RepID=UPI0037441333